VVGRLAQEIRHGHRQWDRQRPDDDDVDEEEDDEGGDTVPVDRMGGAVHLWAEGLRGRASDEAVDGRRAERLLGRKGDGPATAAEDKHGVQTGQGVDAVGEEGGAHPSCWAEGDAPAEAALFLAVNRYLLLAGQPTRNWT
jgi:hypothetical protein